MYWANTYGLSTPVLSDASGVSYNYEVDGYIPSTSLLGPGMEILVIDGTISESDIDDAIASAQ